MAATNGVRASLFDLIISDSFVQNGVRNYQKKSLSFSETESTSKTESNIIFCMIADCFCHLEFIGNPKTFQTTLGGVNLSLRVSAQHDKIINQPCFCFGNGVISVHENFSLKSKICKVEEIINLHTKSKTSQANLRTNYRYPSIESHKLPPSLSLDPPPHNLSAALKIGRVGFQVARSTSKQTPACVAALFPY